MATLTETTVHNRCSVRMGNAGLLGWCEDHRQRVYREGADWHTDPDSSGVVVLDASRRNEMPTGYVTVAAPDGALVPDLIDAAGGRGPFGARVTRYADGTATVAVFND